MTIRGGLVAGTLVGLFAACTPAATSTLEANKDVVRRLVAAVNDRDFDRLDQLVASNVVRHSQATAGLEITSLEQFKQFLRQDLETFPDAHQEIEAVVAEGDKVAVYMTLTGTQNGPMGPFPATGKRVEVKFLGLLRVADGKIAEIWVEWDNLSILTALGHFPPPEGG